MLDKIIYKSLADTKRASWLRELVRVPPCAQTLSDRVGISQLNGDQAKMSHLGEIGVKELRSGVRLYLYAPCSRHPTQMAHVALISAFVGAGLCTNACGSQVAFGESPPQYVAQL